MNKKCKILWKLLSNLKLEIIFDKINLVFGGKEVLIYSIFTKKCFVLSDYEFSSHSCSWIFQKKYLPNFLTCTDEVGSIPGVKYGKVNWGQVGLGTGPIGFWDNSSQTQESRWRRCWWGSFPPNGHCIPILEVTYPNPSSHIILSPFIYYINYDNWKLKTHIKYSFRANFLP